VGLVSTSARGNKIEVKVRLNNLIGNKSESGLLKRKRHIKTDWVRGHSGNINTL